MNPANPDFSNRTASSPALFNRCVIDWFGDWSADALTQVAREFTRFIVPPEESFDTSVFSGANAAKLHSEEHRHTSLVRAITHIHDTVRSLNIQLSKSAKKFNYITPRDFLDFIAHFAELHREKQEKLADEQLHLNSGLQKLRDTEAEVLTLQNSLESQKIELTEMDRQANEKMQLMRVETVNAENSKKSALQLNEELVKESAFIKERLAFIRERLAEAEPALRAAKDSVTKIQKSQLSNIASFSNPNIVIKRTIEAVMIAIQNLKTPVVPSWGEL
jgi:dynein heavy chain 1